MLRLLVSKEIQINSQPSNHPTIQQIERDPNEMSDEELDAEIARLEALGESSGSVVDSSQLAQNNPYNPANNKPIKVTKIGRNDPCPCGSGLKYKKCGLINSSSHKG